MSDWRNLEKLKAMILSEYACEMPHWKDFWKPRAIIFPKDATGMLDCGTFGKLEAMILSENALEMPHWRVSWKVRTLTLPNYASEMSDLGTLRSARP